jgi:ketosteroid isomerase-like protein
MYHRIVAANVRKGFQAMSQGDYQQVIKQFSPDIYFSFSGDHAKGWPWDTVAVTQFRIHAVLRDGRPYTNDGMQFLRIRWGRIVEDRVFEDTYRLVMELRHMGEQGVSEAISTPIGVIVAG